jgi:hypothetical protein
VVQVERVAGRVGEDRLVADARVERLGVEGDAGGLELRPGGGDVGHLQRDRHAVGRERLAERGRVHHGQREVAGLELRAGRLAVALDARQPERLAVEGHTGLEVVGRDADEVDAGDEGIGGSHLPMLLGWKGCVGS